VTGSLNGLGSQHRLGDTPGALRAFEEALQAKRRAGLDEDGALLNLASAHYDLGRPDRAAPLYLQALEGLIRRQFLNQIPAALLGLARLAVDQTQPGLAAQLIAAADTQARRVESVPLPDEQEERRALLSRVRALLDARDPAAATGAWATGSRWTPQDTLDEVRRTLQHPGRDERPPLKAAAEAGRWITLAIGVRISRRSRPRRSRDTRPGEGRRWPRRRAGRAGWLQTPATPGG
jgi:tetratricopeptide (TPR) repeat protein